MLGRPKENDTTQKNIYWARQTLIVCHSCSSVDVSQEKVYIMLCIYSVVGIQYTLTIIRVGGEERAAWSQLSTGWLDDYVELNTKPEVEMIGPSVDTCFAMK